MRRCRPARCRRRSALKTPRDNLFVNGQMDYALTLDQTLRFGYNLTPLHERQPRRRRLRRTGARLLHENRTPQPPRPALRTARPARVLAIAAAALLVRHRHAVGDRGADDSRARLLHQRRRAAAPAAIIRSARQRRDPIWTTCCGRHSCRTGIVARRRLVSLRTRRRTISAPTRSTTWRRISRTSRATTRGASAIRTSRIRTCRAASTSRTTSASRKNLTLSPGVRYEAQTHVGDFANIGPRFGVTWAPFASGQTTLRGSAGIFYDWLPTSTYDQSLRVDGFRQQELNIVNPSFPDPGTGRHRSADQPLPARAATIERAAHDARQRGHRSGTSEGDARVGDLQLSARIAAGAGLNLNPPVNGIRPDPAFSQHRRGRVRRRLAPASAAGRREHQSRRAAAGVQRTAHQLEADDGVRQLHAGVAQEQHRRPVQHSGDRRSRRRMGTRQRRVALGPFFGDGFIGQARRRETSAAG